MTYYSYDHITLPKAVFMLTIDEARLHQNEYFPSDVTRQTLRGTVIVPFVGATAVGKNYLMSASGYHIVGTTVTREPRDDDDPDKYTYLTNDVLLEHIEHGDVVQYAVSPTAPTIYCSLVNDYALNSVNVMDCFFDAVEGLRQTGFQTVKTVSVFATAEQWSTQMRQRYQHNDPTYVNSRLDEAERSIAWSKQQFDHRVTGHLLIINQHDNDEQNIIRIRECIDTNTYTQPDRDEVDRIYSEMNQVISEYRNELDT